MTEAAAVLGIFTAVCGLMIWIFRMSVARRTVDDENTQKLIGALNERNDKQDVKIERLDRKNEECRERESELSAKVGILEGQLSALRITTTQLRGKPVALITANAKGEIINWNFGASELFGWSFEEAWGQQISIVVAPRIRDRHESAFQKAAHRFDIEPHEVVAKILESVAINKRGEELPVIINLSSFQSDEQHLFQAEIYQR